MSTVTQPKRAAPPGQRFPVDSGGNGSPKRESAPQHRRDMRKRIVLGAVLVPGGALLIAAAAMLAGDLGQPEQPLIYYTVTRGDLPIRLESGGITSSAMPALVGANSSANTSSLGRR